MRAAAVCDVCLNFSFYEHVLVVFPAPSRFSVDLFVCVCVYLFIYFVLCTVHRCVYKNAVAAGPAESGYPCWAWLGRHSEIDVILITREVAYHKGPGPVRPFVLCTLRCYTHTHTHVPCFPLIDSLSLSFSFTPSVLKCISPLEMPKTMRRFIVCTCMYYLFCVLIILYYWIC